MVRSPTHLKSHLTHELHAIITPWTELNSLLTESLTGPLTTIKEAADLPIAVNVL